VAKNSRRAKREFAPDFSAALNNDWALEKLRNESDAIERRIFAAAT
jgi:hypothetical protein